MAKQVITRLLDDLDGSDADESVTFALDGIAYEIDLSAKNAGKFREFLGTYIEAGTRTGRVGQGAQLTKHRPTVSDTGGNRQNRELNQAMREWAVANGYELAERGRIPAYIQDAYTTKTPNPARTLAEPEPESLKPERTAAKKTTPAKKTGGSKVVSFSGSGRKTA